MNVRATCSSSCLEPLPGAWVSVKGFASKTLSAAARRLPEDWHSLYGYRPLLLETLVDRSRFRALQGGKLNLPGHEPGPRAYAPAEHLPGQSVKANGSLQDFRVFADLGGEGVAVDSAGNVYLAAGQVYFYDRTGKPIDAIEVPERPLQLVFGGTDRRTLFIPSRTSLYSVRTRNRGR